MFTHSTLRVYVNVMNIWDSSVQTFTLWHRDLALQWVNVSNSVTVYGMHVLRILTLLRDISVDGCSVQYLQQPEEVFAEMHRVLKPGGVAIVSFSNRLFYEKAIAAWRQNTDFGRQQLAKSYFCLLYTSDAADE